MVASYSPSPGWPEQGPPDPVLSSPLGRPACTPGITTGPGGCGVKLATPGGLETVPPAEGQCRLVGREEAEASATSGALGRPRPSPSPGPSLSPLSPALLLGWRWALGGPRAGRALPPLPCWLPAAPGRAASELTLT